MLGYSDSDTSLLARATGSSAVIHRAAQPTDDRQNVQKVREVRDARITTEISRRDRRHVHVGVVRSVDELVAPVRPYTRSSGSLSQRIIT